jgi:hypothetical protein
MRHWFFFPMNADRLARRLRAQFPIVHCKICTKPKSKVVSFLFLAALHWARGWAGAPGPFLSWDRGISKQDPECEILL